MNGNKVLYWLLGALLATLLALLGFYVRSLEQKIESLDQKFYGHEMTTVGGYSRIAVLEVRVEILAKHCGVELPP